MIYACEYVYEFTYITLKFITTLRPLTPCQNKTSTMPAPLTLPSLMGVHTSTKTYMIYSYEYVHVFTYMTLRSIATLSLSRGDTAHRESTPSLPSQMGGRYIYIYLSCKNICIIYAYEYGHIRAYTNLCGVNMNKFVICIVVTVSCLYTNAFLAGPCFSYGEVFW